MMIQSPSWCVPIILEEIETVSNFHGAYHLIMQIFYTKIEDLLFDQLIYRTKHILKIILKLFENHT